MRRGLGFVGFEGSYKLHNSRLQPLRRRVITSIAIATACLNRSIAASHSGSGQAPPGWHFKGAAEISGRKLQCKTLHQTLKFRSCCGFHGWQHPGSGVVGALWTMKEGSAALHSNAHMKWSCRWDAWECSILLDWGFINQKSCSTWTPSHFRYPEGASGLVPKGSPLALVKGCASLQEISHESGFRTT